MAKANRANWQQYTVDAQQDNYYNYPAGADYSMLKGPNHEIQLILNAGAPGSSFNNAPNGSLYIDMTNYKLYIKTGASTWTVVGSQS